MITKSSFLRDSPRGRRPNKNLLLTVNRRSKLTSYFFRKGNYALVKQAFVGMVAVTSQESASNTHYEWQLFLRMRYSGIPLNLNCVSLTVTGIYKVCKDITGKNFKTHLLLFKTGGAFHSTKYSGSLD